MPKTTQTAETQESPQAWWRFPIVWMVWGGPATVVVAGLVTAYIAMSNPDPVLNTAPVVSKSAEGQSPSRSEAPAVQGRNHAATPSESAASR